VRIALGIALSVSILACRRGPPTQPVFRRASDANGKMSFQAVEGSRSRAGQSSSHHPDHRLGERQPIPRRQERAFVPVGPRSQDDRPVIPLERRARQRALVFPTASEPGHD